MRRIRIAILMLLCGGLGIAAFTMMPESPAPLRGELALAPDSLLDFGRVVVGERKKTHVIATNKGTAPLVLNSIEASAGFAVKPATLELAVGESRALAIYFQPDEVANTYQGQLRVAAADADVSEQVIELRGSAHGPAAIHVEPMSLSFGEVSLTGVARATVRVENRGGEDLHIESLGAPAPFKIEGEVGVLAPGEGLDFAVRFIPSDAGRFEASLMVRSTDPDSRSLLVSLKGSGVLQDPEPRLEMATSRVEFGSVPVGGSQTRWIEIANTGVDPLNITQVAVSKPFVGPNRGWRIEPNSTYRLGLRFSPEDEGEASGLVRIFTNDPDFAEMELNLVGVGAPGDAIASNGVATNGIDGIASTPSNDGTQEGGTSSDDSLIVRNRAGSDSGDPTNGYANAPNTLTDGGEPDSAPSASDDAPSDDTLIWGDPTIAEGSRISIGTQAANLSNFHVDSVSIDPSTRMFQIDNLMLPPVNFPLGDFVEFLPVSISGPISDSGNIDIPITVQMRDTVGNITSVDFTLTTGSTSVPTNQGTLWTGSGDALGSGSSIRLVGGARTPLHSSTGQLPFIIDVKVSNVQVQ